MEEVGRKSPWKGEEETLTLGDHPVLSYHLDIPQLEQLGRGGGRITAYYRRLGDHLKKRWRGKCFILACLDYASCQENAREFHPWEMGLRAGEMIQEENRLTVTLQYTECHGVNRATRPLRDVWQLPWGCPIKEKGVKREESGEKSGGKNNF